MLEVVNAGSKTLKHVRKFWLTLCAGWLACSGFAAHAEPVAGGDFASAEAAVFGMASFGAQPTVDRLIDRALSLIGTPYRFGGRRPESGLDCSGLLGVVFAETLGLQLPHNAAQIGRIGEPVAMEDLQPGDLVFFNTLGRSLSHVGLYIGNNEFVHAGSRGKPRAVRINRLDENYFAKRFEGARRIVR